MEGGRTVVVQGERHQSAKLGDQDRRHWTCEQIVR